jgi:hypothetical protein
MVRSWVSEGALRQIFIDEIGRLLDTNARDLDKKITIARVEKPGGPNWEATIDIVGVTTLKAFVSALRKARRLYKLDPASRRSAPA